MHGVELNSVRGSEFCETLTGGFTRKTPTLRRVELPGEWNSQGGGTPRGWNSQGGGIPRGVELPLVLALYEGIPLAGPLGSVTWTLLIWTYLQVNCLRRALLGFSRWLPLWFMCWLKFWLKMEYVDNAIFARVVLFLGEPDTRLSETQLAPIWRQLHSLWWVSRFTSARMRHWYDYCLDIAFHH